MDEIKQRLKDCADACITTYEAWRAKPADHTARETLQEAVHELRKVSARLEIELAVSDRKQHGNEPIPIPSHRASRRPGAPDMDQDEGNNNRGNRDGGRDGGGRDGNRGDGGRRPVQIRQRPEGGEGAQPGNDAPPAPASASGNKPLSLKRTNDSE